MNCEKCFEKIANDAANNYGIGYFAGGLMRCATCTYKRIKESGVFPIKKSKESNLFKSLTDEP